MGNFELYSVTFLKGFKSFLLDDGVVNKNMRFVFLGDEAKSFGVVKAFHGSLRHLYDPPMPVPQSKSTLIIDTN